MSLQRDFEQAKQLREIYYKLFQLNEEGIKVNKELIDYLNNYSFCIIMDFDDKYKFKDIITPNGIARCYSYMWDGTFYFKTKNTYYNFNYKYLELA